jgi:hypothetical protein
MLHAKPGTVQPHFVDGEVVPEDQVIPAPVDTSVQPAVQEAETVDILCDFE